MNIEILALNSALLYYVIHKYVWHGSWIACQQSGGNSRATILCPYRATAVFLRPQRFRSYPGYLRHGGDLTATETDFHSDPIAEAFRWRACEGELIQIIERARGVNRTSDTERVDVLLLTDVPLPIPVDALITADELAPRVKDRMLEAGGVAYQSAEAAADAYPAVFPSGPKLRVQRWREKERHGTMWQPHPWLESGGFANA